jgi:MFS family permease
LYLTEISSWDVRGVIGSMHQFAIVTGYLVSLAIGLLVSFDKTDRFPWSWRAVLGFDLLPSILQLVVMYWYCPESPKYLFKIRGDTIQGEFALRWFRGNSFSTLEYNHYCKNSTDQGTLQRQPTGLFKLLSRYPESHKSLFIIAMLHLAQQLCGINAIFYFSTAIFDEEKSSLAPYVPILIAILNVLMTIISLALMDRAGRRILLLLSVAGMILAFTGFTISMYFSIFVLKAISVLFFTASFAIGMGPVPWLLLGELFSPWCVGAGVTLGVSINWIFNFLVVASFQPLRAVLGKNVVLPYLIFLVIFGIWALFGLPETKGRPAKLL